MKSKCSYVTRFVWLKSVSWILGTRALTSSGSASQSLLPENNAVGTWSSVTLYAGGVGFNWSVGWSKHG